MADEAVAKATAKAVTVVGKAKGTAVAGSSEAAARRSRRCHSPSSTPVKWV